jgi:general secretion pathway protein N
MSRSVTVELIWLVLSVHAAAAGTTPIMTDELDASIVAETRLGKPAGDNAGEPVTSVRVGAPQPAAERSLSANPLWGIPLTRLSGTRDRPIFSPSRRPPPPVLVSEPTPAPPPPPRKKEVEPPPLALVGTIAGEQEGFGIFLDQSTKEALRLKIGEDFQGWKLLAIKGGQVTLEKDHQAAVLTLPPPGGQSAGDVQLIPVSAISAPRPVARSR